MGIDVFIVQCNISFLKTYTRLGKNTNKWIMIKFIILEKPTEKRF